MVVEIPGDSRDILFRLADWYQMTGQNDAELYLLIALLRKFWDLKSRERLAQYHNRIGDWDAAIETWKNIIDKNPRDEKLHDELAAACQAKGVRKIAFRAWEELAIKHPDNIQLVSRMNSLKVNPKYDDS